MKRCSDLLNTFFGRKEVPFWTFLHSYIEIAKKKKKTWHSAARSWFLVIYIFFCNWGIKTLSRTTENNAACLRQVWSLFYTENRKTPQSVTSRDYSCISKTEQLYKTKSLSLVRFLADSCLLPLVRILTVWYQRAVLVYQLKCQLHQSGNDVTVSVKSHQPHDMKKPFSGR